MGYIVELMSHWIEEFGLLINVNNAKKYIDLQNIQYGYMKRRQVRTECDMFQFESSDDNSSEYIDSNRV
jgi:hypothetical protein